MTGLDLVAEQIAIAEGQPLRIAPGGRHGHGPRDRVPDQRRGPRPRVRPQPRHGHRRRVPGRGGHPRRHARAERAPPSPPDYDSLLAKLIVHGPDRAQALRVLRDALARTTIDGVATTIGLHAAIVADPDFATGAVPTGWLPPVSRSPPVPELQLVDVSFRDGNQSLWGATGVRTRHVLQIAPLMDRVGFRALDFTSSTAHGHRGPHAPRGSLGTHPAHPRRDAVHAAAVHRHRVPVHLLGTRAPGVHGAGLRAAGRERHRPLRRPRPDATTRTPRSRRAARSARQAGPRSSRRSRYTISDVHDDPFYARLAALYAASPTSTAST